jgi:hypothetical protein
MATGELAALRSLLADASAISSALGSEAKVEPPGAGYFSDAAESGITRAIQDIATHTGELTMFVGAGVSMEAELPAWNTLVRNLLLAARLPDAEEAAVGIWAGKVLEEGPLAAAAVAEALYADPIVFRRALRDALYQQDPDTYAPGALAGQIAWLKERLGSRLALLTVNYDGLIEAALRERGLEPASYVRAWSEPTGKAAVWHLHGRLIRAASGKSWQSQGTLVLSEGSYVRSTTNTFPQDFVAERLQSSLCVFVGLSMTDPNFIRWLYKSSNEPGGPRYVIFVRQASARIAPDVRRLLEASAAARWARYGVTPVWANYYGEVAQVIHEIGLRCTGEQAIDFSLRASTRLADGASRLAPADPTEFADAQMEGSEWLRRRLQDVRALCLASDPPVDVDGHHLGLGVWAINHATGTIMNWASSDRAYQEPAAIVGNPLHVDSRWVAAAAIANGVSVEEDPAVYASRWRFVRAIPVIVEPNGERSIVGAVTLTSTTPLKECPLAKELAPRGLLNAIDDLLSDQVGALFLT